MRKIKSQNYDFRRKLSWHSPSNLAHTSVARKVRSPPRCPKKSHAEYKFNPSLWSFRRSWLLLKYQMMFKLRSLKWKFFCTWHLKWQTPTLSKKLSFCILRSTWSKCSILPSCLSIKSFLRWDPFREPVVRSKFELRFSSNPLESFILSRSTFLDHGHTCHGPRPPCYIPWLCLI